MNTTSADGLRDAAAWLQAVAADDKEGFNAVATNCDPIELVDALTAAFLWLIGRQGISLDRMLTLMRDTAAHFEGKP